MRRVHEYVTLYEDHELSTVIAREHYHQQLLDADGKIKSERTLNLPTFALRILRPANRKRIRFDKAGEEHVDGTRTWVVAFQETQGPTASATPNGSDVPAHGRFWVDPDSGAVVRSEMILGGTRRVSARATITVSYAHEPSLGFRIPIEMRERYDNPRRKTDDVVNAFAKYSDFRRFNWRAYALGK